MEWRFTLIDRNGARTVIDEPIGWDSFSIRVRRHAERHGTFRELQGNNFQFIGKGGALLREEYEQYGVRGDFKLLIEWKCGNAWSEFYTGTISFDTYNFEDFPVCTVTVDIEQTGPVVSFINRFNQKVDVASAVAFDQVTALTAYPNLTKNIVLISKAITLRGIAKNTGSQEYILSTDSGWFPVSGTGTLQGGINPCFNNVEVDSIKDFDPSSIMDFFNYSNYTEYIPEIIYNNPSQELNCVGTTFDIEFRVKGRYKNLNSGSGNNDLNLVLKKGTNTFNSGATTINSWNIRSSNNNAFTQEFDISYSATVILSPGEKLWLSNFLTYVKTTNYTADVRIEIDAETYFKASVVSKCDPTSAKVYMINETASRITEAITNNQMKVYSEYLGRKDSDPYDFPQAGCGALRALALGLDIRRAKLADGTEPKLFLSMEDVFNHLSATDNIGVGVEGDDKIRIENWKWFYKNNIILQCLDIDKVKKSVITEKIWSTFKTGYDKWETEDYNGQDEILTNRQYRTQVTQVQNELEKTSKIIASGYAIETTRRRSGEDKDWRFDNDVFAICLMNKIYASGAEFIAFSSTIKVPFNQLYQVGFQAHTITVTGSASNDGTYTVVGVSTLLGDILIQVAESLVNESGATIVIEDISGHYAVEVGNIDSPANMIDPDTVYNFRISPVRMAMRWFDRVMAFCKNIVNADKLIFSAADGNYIAEGELKNPDCKLENAVLAENDDLSLTSYADTDDALPIAAAELVEYKYPLTVQEFKAINASPYGLVEYRGKNEKGQGWIEEIQYWPNEGVANFQLIPKL